ncbi:peptidase [Tychonema sp. BBK16]|uniref:peptidase n=1 Tax=Tychonema sp. BBK16 TaxID=2699888 RepID=UPI001F3996EF|nr:peptidase [Tychonema sp. BBK16]MCF6375354.1 peptidase [Tychonema sp. BBK16]
MTLIQDTDVKSKAFDDVINSFNHITNLYSISDPLETFQFIVEQQTIISLIVEAHDKITSLFPNERLGLEVKTDPEIADTRSLWIIIYTKLEVDEAFDKLTILDETWWLKALTSVPKINLHINLEWESNEI